MEGIEQAIMDAARAGKLRARIRKNGGRLTGLTRLADRHSELAKAQLDRIFGETVKGATAPASPTRHVGG